jgi:hypothetical protein
VRRRGGDGEQERWLWKYGGVLGDEPQQLITVIFFVRMKDEEFTVINPFLFKIL